MAETFLTNKDKNELEGKIAEKANKSDVKTVEEVLQNLKISNVAQIKTGSYVGVDSGTPSTVRIPVDFTPTALIVYNSAGHQLTAINPAPVGLWTDGSNIKTDVSIGWGTNAVSWTGQNTNPNMNIAGQSYYFWIMGY